MSTYNTVLQVRFGHVDVAGIVYFPRIYDYLHDVFEEIWEKHVGTRYYQLVLDQRIGFPLVKSEVDFKRPMHFGDRPIVSVSCFRLGTTSLGLRYVFRIADQVCLEARMVTVCTLLDEMKPLPIPDSFRTRFEEILEKS